MLHEVLTRWRYNGFALVHYGFVLKNLDQDYENAAIYIQEGIDTNEPGTQDGRFYFNLGDALQRLGRNDEARAVCNEFVCSHIIPTISFLRFTRKALQKDSSCPNTKDLSTTSID